MQALVQADATKLNLDTEGPGLRTRTSAGSRFPARYFDAFIRKVVTLLHGYFTAIVEEQVAELKRRVHENTETYFKELHTYTGRKREPEEELYIYEPLQYWDKEKQEVMRGIIKTRLAMLCEGGIKLKPFEEEGEEEDWEAELEEQRRLLQQQEEARRLAARLEKEQRQRDLANKKRLAQEAAEAAALAELAAKSAAREQAEAARQQEEQQLQTLPELVQDFSREAEDLEGEVLRLRQEIEALEKEGKEARTALKELQEQIQTRQAKQKELEAAVKAKQEMLEARREVQDMLLQDPEGLVLEPADQAKLKRRIAELQGEMKRLLAAEKEGLRARVTELEEEIQRLQALLKNALVKKKERPPKIVSEVRTWKPSSSPIFDRLFKDASHRVTRSIRALDHKTWKTRAEDWPRTGPSPEKDFRAGEKLPPPTALPPTAKMTISSMDVLLGSMGAPSLKRGDTMASGTSHRVECGSRPAFTDAWQLPSGRPE